MTQFVWLVVLLMLFSFEYFDPFDHFFALLFPLGPYFKELRLCWLPNANEIYMANLNPNVRRPNATYIPPAHVGAGVGHYRLALGLQALRWVCKDF